MLLAAVFATPAYADQAITPQQLIVKDTKPGVDPTRREVTLEAGERSSTHTILGDPTTGGAVLSITLSGSSSANQVFDLGAGIDLATGKPYWKASDTGFIYKNRFGTNGPVKAARIELSNGGTFKLKVSAVAKHSPITLRPPNPGSFAFITFEIGGGDAYNIFFTGEPFNTIKKNDAKTFQIVNVPDPHPPCEASGAPLCTNGRCAVGTCVSLVSICACQ
jgi:hypothetical protein